MFSRDSRMSLRSGKYGLAGRGTHPGRRHRLGRRKTLLLVHGFNTSERNGLSNLWRFRNLLAKLNHDASKDICPLLWPGDSWARGAAYSIIVRRVPDSAMVLRETIERWYARMATRELVIVAHSLGCRLVLELLRLFQESRRPPGLERLTVILMAAAVPVRFMERGGRLHGVAAEADARAVLYSRDDSVLKYLFRIGQAAAAEGMFPVAVGLAGNPVPAWTVRRNMAPFGHNDYWPHRRTAREVCTLAGVRISALAPRDASAEKARLKAGPSISREPLAIPPRSN